MHTNYYSQIRKSPQACAFFKTSCRETDVPELELVQFVRTCWASMFTFLERLLKLQKVRAPLQSKDVTLNHLQAIIRFVQLADESDEVPTLRNKKYSDYRLSKLEWDKLKLMHEVLRVCCWFTLT